MNSNFISVIIVTYNAERYINNCLDSLLEQNWDDFRVVIVDNNSQDDTFDILKKYQKYQKIKILQNTKNLGFAKANNIGIKFSLEELGADHCLLLNQDTVVENNLLERYIYWYESIGPAAFSPKVLIKKNRKVWWVGSKVFSLKDLFTNYRLAAACQLNKEKPDTFVFETPVESGPIPGCSLFLPGEVIQSVGYLDERFFMYMEDLDYFFRLTAKGYKSYLVPGTVVLHDVNLENDALQEDKNIWKTLNRYRMYFSSTLLVLIKHFSWIYILIWLARSPIAITFEISKRFLKK